MIIERVSSYIKNKRLFELNSKLLIGLSGGADSVALLHILHQLGYNIVAAHCNFHLRGEESNRDEFFVRKCCQSLNIPLEIIHFETEEYAKENHLSIEMAARELRYDWFEKIRQEQDCNFIAIAHHRDDNVETLILNLARGTGIKGLTGIQPINGYIRRPFLTVSREEIISYLASIGQSFVTDSTNLEDQFARNKIRLNILPELYKINPASVENIEKTISYLQDVNAIYEKSINEAKLRISELNKIYISRLLKEIAPQTLLFEICSAYGFNSSQVNDIYKSLETKGEKLFYSASHQISKSRNLLIIDSLTPLSTIEPEPAIEYDIVEKLDSFKITPSVNTAYFDADMVDPNSLIIRKWKQGDYFIPFGMNGKKRISDFFTDNKFNKEEKESQWLLTHNGDIIWVIGKRTDNRFRITDQTKRVLIAKIKNK